MNGTTWRQWIALGGMASLGFVAACSSDDPVDSGVTPDGGVNTDSGVQADAGQTGFEQPANTVPVNFTIDDSANGAYDSAALLTWKGSFNYNETTRIATRDTSWGGGTMGYAHLYDDGAWNMGGHEPAGATAGDHKWGIAMFVEIPTDADLTFDYGAARDWEPGREGSWIWVGTNGSFTVPVGATEAITATGLTIPAFGTVDFRLLIDTSTLAAGFETFDPSTGMGIKSSAWGWTPLAMKDDGTGGDDTANDGVFSFQLGNNVGTGKALPYSGKLKSGDEPQFVFLLGYDPVLGGGLEYKLATVPSAQGVKAQVKAEGAGTWTDVSVTNKADGDKNTFIVVP